MPSDPASHAINAGLLPTAASAEARVCSGSKPMDEETFRRLYVQTSRSLFGYLWHASGRRELAEDLLQETYCRLLSANLAAMSAAETKTYLFRIATNLLHDHWRRQRRWILAGFFGLTAADADSHKTPHDEGPRIITDLAAQTDLRCAFEKLKPRERELLHLAYVEGLSHQEIAASTGLRASSIRLLLFRARRSLAALLR